MSEFGESNDIGRQQVPEVPKPPKFLKEFSKQESSEARKAAAAEIRQKRSSYFERTRSLSKQRVEIADSKDMLAAEELKRLEELRNVEATLDELPNDWFTKTLRFIQIRRLKQRIAEKQILYDTAVRDMIELHQEEERVKKRLEQRGIEAELGEARVLLYDFYKQEKEKWKEAPYNTEGLRKYFSEEHLASLSLDDYVTLLQRFPSEIVTHVTRQGVRDHYGHAFHSVGLWKYNNDFHEILKDRRLKSTLGIHLKEGAKEEGLAKYWRLESSNLTKQQQLEMLDKYIDPFQQMSGSFADKTAIHFATEEVADYAYGGERGNEVFFAFPSAFIAANFYYKGQLRHSGGEGWNDQWVFQEDDNGIDINAGIVFFPGIAPVDPKTGSQYQLDENMHPVPDIEKLNLMKDLIKRDDFFEFLQSVREKIFDQRWETHIPVWKKTIEQQFGVTDEAIQNAMFNPTGFFGVFYPAQQERGIDPNPHYQEAGLDNYVQQFLKSAGILYKRAVNTVDSHIYWEKYLADHPDQKPNKIVYYSGDPTVALQRWKKGNGLTKKTQQDLFPEHDVSIPPYFNERAARFKALATVAIEKHSNDEPIFANHGTRVKEVER